MRLLFVSLMTPIFPTPALIGLEQTHSKQAETWLDHMSNDWIEYIISVLLKNFIVFGIFKGKLWKPLRKFLTPVLKIAAKVGDPVSNFSVI